MASTACCMCFGIVASGTWRRFSRAPLVISAVSSGASSSHGARSCPSPATSSSRDADGAAARGRRACRRGAGNVDAHDLAAERGRSRGVMATALRTTANSPGPFGRGALRVAEVVQPGDRSCSRERLAAPQLDRPRVDARQRALALAVQPRRRSAGERDVVVGDDGAGDEREHADDGEQRSAASGARRRGGGVSCLSGRALAFGSPANQCSADRLGVADRRWQVRCAIVRRSTSVTRSDDPVRAHVERQFVAQTIDERRAVLVQKVDEADLRAPAGGRRETPAPARGGTGGAASRPSAWPPG